MNGEWVCYDAYESNFSIENVCASYCLKAERVCFKIGNLELPSETNRFLHRQHMTQKKITYIRSDFSHHNIF